MARPRIGSGDAGCTRTFLSRSLPSGFAIPTTSDQVSAVTGRPSVDWAATCRRQTGPSTAQILSPQYYRRR